MFMFGSLYVQKYCYVNWFQTFFDWLLVLDHDDLWKLKEQRETYKTIRGHWRLRTQQSTQQENWRQENHDGKQITVWKNQGIYSHLTNISWIQFPFWWLIWMKNRALSLDLRTYLSMSCKNIAFTKFLSKKSESKFL